MGGSICLRRSWRLTALLLSAVMLVLAACSGSSSKDKTPPAGDPGKEEAKKGPNGEAYGGTYRIPIGEEPPGIDPQVDTTLQVYALSRNIFNTLVRFKGETLDLEPELVAEMPKAEADNVTYHFKLREGVTFHNGQKLTAKDVKYTFERMLNPATKAKNTWVLEEVKGAEEMLAGKATELAGIKVTGDYNFDIILKRPYGPFLQNLATPPASIFPAEYTQQKGDDFQRQPIGSGPFKLADWKANQLLVLERNGDYFEKGYPFLDKVEYKVIPEQATRWMEFQQGNFDEGDVPDADFKSAYDSGKYLVKEYISLNSYYLSLNHENFPDKRVREAVSLAIDREKILKTVLNDQGTVLKSFVTPGIPGAMTGGAGFKYDPEKAKALLKEANAVGTKVEMWQRGGDKVGDGNLAMQQMLKDVGFDATVQIADRSAFRDMRSQGKIPANYGNWYADFPDPDNYLYTYFHSSSSKGMSVSYNDQQVDKILEEARGLADQAKRQKMYQDLEQKLIYEEYAIIPLWSVKSYDFYQKNIRGIITHPTGLGGLKTVWKESK